MKTSDKKARALAAQTHTEAYRQIQQAYYQAEVRADHAWDEARAQAWQTLSAIPAQAPKIAKDAAWQTFEEALAVAKQACRQSHTLAQRALHADRALADQIHQQSIEKK